MMASTEQYIPTTLFLYIDQSKEESALRKSFSFKISSINKKGLISNKSISLFPIREARSKLIMPLSATLLVNIWAMLQKYILLHKEKAPKLEAFYKIILF
jgi:hypothetical protein